MRNLALLLCLLLLAACAKANTESPASAPGHDCSTAIPVDTVADEYLWIKKNYPGARLLKQSLSSCQAENFPVDVLKIQLPDGSSQDLYFNIAKVMEGYKAMFEKALKK